MNWPPPESQNIRRYCRGLGPNSAPPAGFAEQLRTLANVLNGKRVRVADLLEASRGRGMNLALVFLSLPFLTPVPLPGFSIPFGIAFVIIGGRIALGQKPWLPQRILNRELPPGFVNRLLKASAKIVRVMETILHPRWKTFQEHMLTKRTAGLLIALSGFFMMAPLPIPFSNSLPACTVLLIAAGLMEHDGVVVALGFALFFVTAAFFLLLGLGGTNVMNRILEKAY